MRDEVVVEMPLRSASDAGGEGRMCLQVGAARNSGHHHGSSPYRIIHDILRIDVTANISTKIVQLGDRRLSRNMPSFRQLAWRMKQARDVAYEGIEECVGAPISLEAGSSARACQRPRAKMPDRKSTHDLATDLEAFGERQES